MLRNVGPRPTLLVPRLPYRASRAFRLKVTTTSPTSPASESRTQTAAGLFQRLTARLRSQQRVQVERWTFRERYRHGLSITSWVIAFYLAYHIFVTHFFEGVGAYGISMLPTIDSYGIVLFQNKWYRLGRDINVGDIIGYKHPVKPGEEAVKRVLGMPGDFVLRDTPGKGEGMMIQIPDGHCWVVGDNLLHSRDSRIFGPLPLALVTGKVIGRLDWYYGFIPWIRGFDEPWLED